MDKTTELLAEEAIRTIHRTGGVTLETNTLLPQEWERGYCVGIGGIAIAADDLDSAVALAWLARRVGGEYMTPYVGFWYDDGKYFIDGVRYIADLITAENVARAHGQKAIYDWSLRDSRLIPYTEDHDR